MTLGELMNKLIEWNLLQHTKITVIDGIIKNGFVQQELDKNIQDWHIVGNRLMIRMVK